MSAVHVHRGNTVAAGVVAVGVVVVGIALLIIGGLPGFGGGGGGDGGEGVGNNAVDRPDASAATRPVADAQPPRPLRVRIEESRYLVNGQSVELAALLQMAGAVPAGDGAAVMIERADTSRAKAENDLREVLDREGISYSSD